MKNMNLPWIISTHLTLAFNSGRDQKFSPEAYKAMSKVLLVPMSATVFDRAALDILSGIHLFAEKPQRRFDYEGFAGTFSDLAKEDPEHYGSVMSASIDEDIEKNALYRILMAVEGIFEPLGDLFHKCSRVTAKLDIDPAQPLSNDAMNRHLEDSHKLSLLAIKALEEEKDEIIEHLNYVLETFRPHHKDQELNLSTFGGLAIFHRSVKGFLNLISAGTDSMSREEIINYVSFLENTVQTLFFHGKCLSLTILKSISEGSEYYIPFIKHMSHLDVERQINE